VKRPNLQRHEREALRAAEAEAAKHGATVSIGRRDGRGHLRFTLWSEDREMLGTVGVANSPRTCARDCANYTRQSVARTLKQGATA
jgi:hypothetical protein